MKSSTLFLFISILGLAVADVNNYYFYAVTDDGDSEVDNQYVQAALETDDTVYFFLGPKSDAVTFACDTSADKCTVSFQDQTFQIGYNDDYFVVGVIDGTGIDPYTSLETDADSMANYGGVYINGYEFHAKKDVGDPLLYSKEKFALLTEDFVADSSTYGFKLNNEKAPRNATEDAGVFNPSSIVIEDDAEAGSSTVIFNETDSATGSSSARNVSSVSATLTKSGSKSTTLSSSHVTSTANSGSAEETGSSETGSSNSASSETGSSNSASSATGTSGSASTGSQTSSGGAQSKYVCSGVGIVAIIFALF